jgi:hypothetical protein
VLDVAGGLATALGSKYSEFPNSSTWRLFSLGEDAFEVLVHGRHGNLEQLGDQRLSQPERVGPEAALNARTAVFGLVKDDAGLRRGVVGDGRVILTYR